EKKATRNLTVNIPSKSVWNSSFPYEPSIDKLVLLAALVSKCKIKAKILVTTIPITKPPGTLRKYKTNVKIKQNSAKSTNGLLRSPKASKERCPPERINWAFSRPRTTKNIPIPAVIPCLRLAGIASANNRLKGVNATIKYNNPLTALTAKACCQVNFID